MYYWFFVYCIANVYGIPLTWERLDIKDPKPNARRGMALIFDEDRERLVMFGGKGQSYFDDTWEFFMSNSSWRRIETSTAPQPRFTMVFGYDKINQRMIIATGEGIDFYNDAWYFDLRNNTWNLLHPSGTPPSIRYGSAGGIINGSSDGTLYLTHGFSSKRFDDTFSVQDTEWKDLSISYRPFARCLHAGGVTHNSNLFIFGGCGSQGHGPCPAYDTWKFNLLTKEWMELDQCPGPRTESTMVRYHFSQSMYLLFGGNEHFYRIMKEDEISVLNVDEGKWMRLQTVASNSEFPNSRLRYPGMVTIENGSSSYVLMFGGGESSDDSNEMWKLSGRIDETKTLSCPFIFRIREFHGALMFLSWGFLLPIGATVARYGKELKTESHPKELWFIFHKYCQPIGVFLAIGGFITAIIMVPVHRFSIPHHIIGLIVMIIGIDQPINGIFRPQYEEGKPKPRSRICWEYFHKTSGRIGITLGIINCILGLRIIRAHVAVFSLYLIWICALILFWIYQEYKRCTASKSKSSV